ncbi:MAG: hypothetical protein K6G00_07110 [Treponema sp.]|nr:hypothetical protein [Treponema sp.]
MKNKLVFLVFILSGFSCRSLGYIAGGMLEKAFEKMTEVVPDKSIAVCERGKADINVQSEKIKELKRMEFQ